jgi:hypothetical protein
MMNLQLKLLELTMIRFYNYEITININLRNTKEMYF